MIIERPWSVQIETPEGVRFSYALAGPVSRFLAWCLDSSIILGASSGLAKTLDAVGVLTGEWSAVLSIVGYYVISIGYGIFFEWLWRGETLGKRVLAIRVMDAEGLRLTFHQIAIRNLLRAVDSLPLFYLVGGAVMTTSRHAQRLGDLAAGTIVVRDVRKSLSVPEQIRTGKYNSFAAYPHLVARLRQSISPTLIEIAVSALERREQFSPGARLQLFHSIASRLQERVQFPEEARVYLTDEQYVRGLVDELTKSARRKVTA